MSFSTKSLEENIKSTKIRLEELGIVVPNAFSKKCYKVATNYKDEPHRFYKGLGPTDVSSAIKLANYWRETLANDEEYNKLVIEIIYKLYGIQCFTVNNNPECEKLYIGHYCKLKDSPLVRGTKGKVRTSILCLGGKIRHK